MSVIHQDKANPIDARVLAFPVAILIALVALLLRLWYLQVVLSDSLVEKMRTTRSTKVRKLAPRGLIVDRKGVLLAGVRPQIVVTAQPRIALKHPENLRRVAALSGASEESIREKLQASMWRPYVPTPIVSGISIEQATKIAERASELEGFGVDSLPTRFYPDSSSFAHVLGYVWTPNDMDVKRLEAKGLEPAEYVGKIGLERVYEAELMGKPGVDEMEIDARRRPVRMVARDNATPGQKLILSLDADLQKAAMERLKGRRGAVAAIDPRSGEVLCLASSPTYDAAQFLGGISAKEYRALLNDESHPQINRAIASAYAPGSTFKIVTTIAALLDGSFSPSRRVVCPGYYQMGKRRFRCLGRHGSISFRTAFARSCNTYFATLAVDAGPERLREACSLVGLGERTGIDLVGESKGVVPTDAWIRRWRDPPKWYGGDTVNFGIGQGELSTTPLQMANVMAIVANRGVGYRPHLVKAVEPYGEEGRGIPIQPELSAQIEAPSSFWDAMTSALGAVVSEGTARGQQIPGVAWGGKTGSAENRRNKQTHSWFVCLAPLQSPRIAMCVLVENAGHGSEVAAPIARDLVRRFLRGSDAGVQVQTRPSANDRAASEASRAPASSP